MDRWLGTDALLWLRYGGHPDRVSYRLDCLADHQWGSSRLVKGLTICRESFFQIQLWFGSRWLSCGRTSILGTHGSYPEEGMVRKRFA